MKKTLIYSLLIMFGLASVFAQHPTDSTKRVKADSISVYSKLSSDQIYELEKERIESKNHKAEPWESSIALFIPIMGICSGILIILIIFFFSYKAKKSRNDVFMKYAELGKAIPQEFLESEKKSKPTLSRGIIQVGIGLGLMIFLYVFLKKGIWTVGFIPLFIGIGYIIIHFIEKKTNRNNEPNR